MFHCIHKRTDEYHLEYKENEHFVSWRRWKQRVLQMKEFRIYFMHLLQHHKKIFLLPCTYFFILYLHLFEKIIFQLWCFECENTNKKQFHPNKTYATVLTTPQPLKNARNSIFFARRKSIQKKRRTRKCYFPFFCSFSFCKKNMS